MRPSFPPEIFFWHATSFCLSIENSVKAPQRNWSFKELSKLSMFCATEKSFNYFDFWDQIDITHANKFKTKDSAGFAENIMYQFTNESSNLDSI